jgi:hypothetical protein
VPDEPTTEQAGGIWITIEATGETIWLPDEEDDCEQAA